MEQRAWTAVEFATEPRPAAAEQLDQPESPTGLRPEAWVGTAADYAAGQRYGAWIGMARPEPDVIADVKAVLEHTPDALGATWGMFAARGFGYWTPSPIDSLRAVNRAARNIAELGLPYSALVAAVGPDSLAISPDRYRHSFVGEFASRRAFAEQVAADSGWYDRLRDLPRTMQGFVHIDVDALIGEAERELTIVDIHEGGIWVYDPRVW